MMGQPRPASMGGTGHARRVGAGHRRWKPCRSVDLVGVALAAGALILAGCGTDSSDGAGKSEHGIVNISGQNFPEAQIMAEIYAGVLAKPATRPA